MTSRSWILLAPIVGAAIALAACGSTTTDSIGEGNNAEPTIDATTVIEEPPSTSLLPVLPATTLVPALSEVAELDGPVVASPVSEPCPTSADFESIEIGSDAFDDRISEQTRLEPMLGQVMGYLAERPDVAGTAGMVWHSPDDGSVFVSFAGEIESHRESLRTSVLLPDELIVCQVGLDSASSGALEAQLVEELAGRFISIGRSARGLEVALAPGELALAEELDARYGDAINVKVGALDFPLDTASSVCPDSKPGRDLDGLTVEIVPPDGPLVATGLEPAQVAVELTNVGDAPIDFLSGVATGRVLDASGRIVNIDVLGVPLIGIAVILGPGDSMQVEMLVSTASCDPAVGAELPPGDYELVANIPYTVDQAGDLTSAPLPITIGE